MRFRAGPSVLRVVGLLGLWALAGCYRTHIVVGPDAGPPTPDAWSPPPPDAWRPDAWAPDAFVPPSECARDLDCAGRLCVQDLSLPPRDLELVPLHCAGPVGTLPPGAECDSNAACDHGMCALAGGCVDACLSAADCRAGERCARVPVVTSESSLQFAQGCVRWVDPPPGVSVVANDTLTFPSFSTQRVVIDPLATPTRFTLLVADALDDNRYVSSVATSAGETVFDAFQLGAVRQDLVVAPFQDHVPILVPNGDRDFALGTGFVAQLETGATTTMHRLVMDRASAGSSVDVNVFYVGVAPPRGGSPPLEVRRMLDQLGVLLGRIELRVGRERHFVVPGATARTFEIIESDAEVGDLFAYSAGAARAAINVFLIRSGFDFLGIAGGAPGAMVVHGTRGSGIAIGFEDVLSFLPMAPDDELGTVIGHEMGHFVGMFHTTEIDGTVIEPLSDTPECSLAQDSDGDGMLMPFECDGFGADNVMFWGPFQAAPRWSPRQTRIFQNAMVLQ